MKLLQTDIIITMHVKGAKWNASNYANRLFIYYYYVQSFVTNQNTLFARWPSNETAYQTDVKIYLRPPLGIPR